MINSNPDNRHKEARTGLFYGITAYWIWGFFPVFFKAIESVPALQVVSHRIVWSLLLLILISFSGGKWKEVQEALKDRRSILLLFSSAVLIAVNWLVFIVAVGHGQVLQSSLGYFITPFVSILLGMLFLKEQLSKLQLTSLLLAAGGVIIITISYGRVPGTALILAITFGTYGLLRKIVKTDALAGLTVETLILAPAACAYLLSIAWQGTGSFLQAEIRTNLLLMSSGVLTAIPLLLFAAAARRLRLATVGFLQYITPTMHFLLAVKVYNEPFTTPHLAGFMLIWSGLLCYSWDAWRVLSMQRRLKKEGLHK
jgi:chloramphenicol-sensitive protein RarD